MPFENLNFYARMAGGAGHHVVHEGHEVYRADFLLPSWQEARSVRFEATKRHVEASPDLTMTEAAYIVALSARKTGGILRVPTTTTERDKLRLYMAAQTHHLRILVEKLEQGSITAVEKQLLGSLVRQDAIVPVIEMRDKIRGNDTPYLPPRNIIQIDLGTGTKTEKLVSEAVDDLRVDLCIRALKKDSSLSPIASGEEGIVAVGMAKCKRGDYVSLPISAVMKYLRWARAFPCGANEREHQGAMNTLFDELKTLWDRGYTRMACRRPVDPAMDSAQGFVARVREGLRSVGCSTDAAGNTVIRPAIEGEEVGENNMVETVALQPANPPKRGKLWTMFAQFARWVTGHQTQPTNAEGARQRLNVVLQQDRGATLAPTPS